jgi:hypothetical protein
MLDRCAKCQPQTAKATFKTESYDGTYMANTDCTSRPHLTLSLSTGIDVGTDFKMLQFPTFPTKIELLLSHDDVMLRFNVLDCLRMHPPFRRVEFWLMNHETTETLQLR